MLNPGEIGGIEREVSDLLLLKKGDRLYMETITSLDYLRLMNCHS